MGFVRTTGGLLQLQAKKLTTEMILQAAVYARDVANKPEIYERIMAQQRKQPPIPVPKEPRKQGWYRDPMAPVLNDFDAFHPDLFRRR